MLILGHRGEPRLAPENTLASFALVRDDLSRGVGGAECDVQMTKDGELVVIHDETVDRTTDGTGWVKDLTLQQIRTLNVASRFPGSSRHERVPTMSEVLALFDGTGAVLNIELKNSKVAYDGMEERLLRLVDQYHVTVMFSSFNHDSMGLVRALDTSSWTGLLYNPWLRAPDVVAAARKQRASAVHPFYLNATGRLVQQLHAAGVAVAPWTVDTGVALRRNARLGVDTIITNNPRAALAALAP
ncbi:MAG TPA: glycerophosphodiester phosphodiesterase family protein [Candidatus Cryosericum sp.]